MAETSETDPKRGEECRGAPTRQCILGDESSVGSRDNGEQSSDIQECDEPGIHEGSCGSFYIRCSAPMAVAHIASCGHSLGFDFPINCNQREATVGHPCPAPS